MRITGAKNIGRTLMTAALVLCLAAAMTSCVDSDGPGNAAPTGPGGGGEGPPVSGPLSVNPATITFTVPEGYPGGDSFFFFATGGRPPYRWDVDAPGIGFIQPIDDTGDGSFRKARYTVNTPPTIIGDANILLTDNNGDVVTATFTLDLQAR